MNNLWQGSWTEATAGAYQWPVGHCSFRRIENAFLAEYAVDLEATSTVSMAFTAVSDPKSGVFLRFL